MEQVSWDDIQVFLTRLNAQQAGILPNGWAYVLPTEAQWEYACRAGTTTSYSWGHTISASNANSLDSGIGHTTNVGEYLPNQWDFFDMAGNVREWTPDWYSTHASIAVTDPAGPPTGLQRVTRGGSWFGVGEILRSAARSYNYNISTREDFLGFRLAFKQVTQQEIDLNATDQNLYAYEQKPVGTAIGVFVTDAPDRGVSSKYSLKSNYPDESNFSIRGNILYSADVFDASIKQDFEIGIDIESPDGYVTSETINIWVAKDYSHQHLVVDATNTDLSGANFTRATMLPGSIFVHAKLIGADLTDANFSKVNLWNADLSGADLSGTLLKGAVFNSETKWPDGFDPIAVGAILLILLREIFCGPTKNWTCFLWTNLCGEQIFPYIENGGREVLYSDLVWDVSRDRRSDKYPTFDGLVQSYSPMTYFEINAEDPNGYNDLLHSSIQGPFTVDTEIVHDERALRTEKKQDENILIDGVTYPAKVYQIKEIKLGLMQSCTTKKNSYLVGESKRAFEVGLKKILSEFYGWGILDPYLDEFFTYTLVIENNPNQPVDTVLPELKLFGGTDNKLGEPWTEPGFCK